MLGSLAAFKHLHCLTDHTDVWKLTLCHRNTIFIVGIFVFMKRRFTMNGVLSISIIIDAIKAIYI